MASRIKHMAISSSKGPTLSRFYYKLFGMSTYTGEEPTGATAQAVTDGYVGLNLNPQSAGRTGGFHHFGIEIDDLDIIRRRLADAYPTVSILKRPSSRPFAGLTTHDPAGNIFDLSHRNMENRRGVYADPGATHHPRHLEHFMLRVVDVPAIARFYRDVFDLRELDRADGDPNVYLTDGIVTMIVAPWDIQNYAGMGVERPSLDHLGFHVESLDRFKADLDRMIENEPDLTPAPWRVPEGEARRELLRACTRGHFQLADPAGTLLDISE